MFVITNRAIDLDEDGLDVFGKKPNSEGANEIRLLEVKGRRPYRVELLDDELPDEALDVLEQQFGFKLDRTQKWYSSLRVACALFDRARRERKHVLVYVHGYNNDMRDVMRTAHELERLYGVIVVPFSWPANGGGKISGTAAYLSDKDDARASATALHRAVQKMAFYHRLLTEGLQRRLRAQADTRHPDDHERAHELFSRLLGKECSTSLNLLCHSMGNYVFKYASRPSNSSLQHLTFDNIALVAADVNNPGHAEWLENIPARNRVYVVINENDSALKWSRRKPGDEQQARLGHHLRGLVASNAYYLDVTRSRSVGDDHSYFKGNPVNRNARLHRLFSRIFGGQVAENTMAYHPDLNVYRPS